MNSRQLFQYENIKNKLKNLRRQNQHFNLILRKHISKRIKVQYQQKIKNNLKRINNLNNSIKAFKLYHQKNDGYEGNHHFSSVKSNEETDILDTLQSNPNFFKSNKSLINNIKNFKVNDFNKKVYISQINYDCSEFTNCKGINIDNKIIKSKLDILGFNTEFLKISNDNLENYSLNSTTSLYEEIPLDGEFYIFSEILLYDLFVHLIKNDKNVILIPNIDSFSCFREDKNYSFFLNELNENDNFYIWSKTLQIKNWLNSINIENTFINFNFSQNKDYNISDKKITNLILLDTGSSCSRRKYCIKVINEFMICENSFHLIVKTVPSVYHKFNLKQYESFTNITVINKYLTDKELDKFYEEFNFFIYLAKFDSFGLSLSKAISKGLFIFCADGKPWNELLKYYPRKCLIHCEQNFNINKNDRKKGFVGEQIYYKVNFDDFKSKIKDYKKFEYIINKTTDYVNYFNFLNKNIFSINLIHFFNKQDCTSQYYKNSNLFLTSFNDRKYILLENLMSTALQAHQINIYLNDTNEFTEWWLNKIGNVNIIPFNKDYKALGKLYAYCKSTENEYNFIIDDDIFYPIDYVETSINKIKTCIYKSNSIYSYNGFTNKFKLSFVKKHNVSQEPNILNEIGTGTLIFKKGILDTNSLEKILDHKDNIFCDKLLSKYLKENIINMIYLCPNKSIWMKNNKKIRLNKIPGLFEYKKLNNLNKDKLGIVNYSSGYMLQNLSYYNNILFIKNENSRFDKILNNLKQYYYITEMKIMSINHLNKNLNIIKNFNIIITPLLIKQIDKSKQIILTENVDSILEKIDNFFIETTNETSASTTS
jgi:hypothetical protein